MVAVRHQSIALHRRGARFLHHAFIPHAGNNHHPLAVRPRALKAYSVALVALKLALTGFLYSVYPTQAYYAELTASKILELTNASRTAAQLPALRSNAALTKAADEKAANMLRAGYFEHTRSDGKRFWQWIRDAGYDYTTAGENLAMDFTTAESAHAALMASPSHRANLLKSSYTDIGLSVMRGTLNGKETILLVEMFGAPLPEAIPVEPSALTATEPVTVPNSGQATAQSPTTQASVVATSDAHLSLLPGTTASVWIDYRNVGTAAWDPADEHFLALNVTNPAGRTSAFANDWWLAPYRPTRLHATVAAGATGRISFPLTAPMTPGTYNETFALVAEGSGWLEDTTVTFPITVVGTVAGTETSGNAVELTAPDSVLVEPTTEQPAPLAVAPSHGSDWRQTAVDVALRFFWGFLIFLCLSLLLSVLIRVRIQHPRLVLQTLAVIVLASATILVKLHFLERLASPFVR